jgi:23S rRNA pseudouridine2605 synthase
MTERSAPGVRLQKVLARAGVASRRAAERLIAAGRVRVDGRVARELGVRVDPRNSRIEVDGKRIIAEPLIYIVLNKPRGVVCTLSDPEGRPTVAELLRGAGARVLPVGRLDFNTGGALLCTNDGEFANRVAHPRHHAPKEYLVKVGGVVDERSLAAVGESIAIDGRATKPADVKLVRVEGDKSWLAVRLEEGRNRQVRRLAEHAGLVVMRLVRTSHAGITVEGVRPGRFRHLTVDELTELRDVYGVPKRIPRPPPVDERRSAPARPAFRPHERSTRRNDEREERGPVRGERGPVRGERGAVRGERGPVRGERGPVRGERGPVRGERGPVRGERGPVRGERGPVRGERTPGRAERAPGRGEQAGGRAERAGGRGRASTARGERAFGGRRGT